MQMKVFLSYRFADEPFVRSTSYYLTKQSELTAYFYGDEKHDDNWVREVSVGLADADAFVFFLGAELGHTQELEARALLAAKGKRPITVIRLPDVAFPSSVSIFQGFTVIDVATIDEKGAQECAKKITESFKKPWVPVDDIPDEYIFEYEKDIIAAYREGTVDPKLIGRGCPRQWPKVERRPSRTESSPLREDEAGLFRDRDYANDREREGESLVLASALKDVAPALITNNLCFPEAGPRKNLSYPSRPRVLRAGVLVSGGIAPGINAVIAGIVERQTLYATRGKYRLNINGYQNGLNALYYPTENFRTLTRDDVEPYADNGGSILGTSRLPQFMDRDPSERRKALKRAIEHLTADGVEILYIIGGDGSMRAAHALWKTARDLDRDISIIGVPKTMDNDILWVWQSFGFLSAVQRSKDLIQDLHTEAQSNPRLCVVQLFGSDSGFVVTHAVSAIGVCDLFLIPEVPFTMKTVCEYIGNRLKARYDESRGLSTYGHIVMSETAIPRDASDYFDDPEVNLTEKEKSAVSDFLTQQRVFGQTPDELRSGGLKLVTGAIQTYIKERKDVLPEPYWRNFRVFTNEPRHLIRATSPSSLDTITAKRLGYLAVDGAMAGYTDFMISQWLTEYVMVPLRLVILGRKRIPRYGVFYKSARASTDQPADLE
jgi:6-phosphofructokinase 1